MTTRGIALMLSHHPIWQLGKKRNQIPMENIDNYPFDYGHIPSTIIDPSKKNAHTHKKDTYEKLTRTRNKNR